MVDACIKCRIVSSREGVSQCVAEEAKQYITYPATCFLLGSLAVPAHLRGV